MTLTQDAFTRADGGLGTNYTLLSGLAPRIASNRVLANASVDGTQESHVLHNTATGSADMHAQVAAKWVSDYGNLAVIARGTDINNHYLVFINQEDKRAELVCWKAGGYRQLRTGSNDELTWSVGTTVTFRLEVTGTGATVTIVLKANGTTVFTYADSHADRLTTGQKGGFGFAYVPNDAAFEIDNFETDQIGGGTAYTATHTGTVTPAGAITTNKTTGTTGGTDSITKSVIVTAGEVETGIWEAEDAALTTTYPTDPYAMRVASANAGFLGTGYVGVWGLTGEKITFTLAGQTAASYTLHYRYQQCGNDVAPTRTVWVNSVQVATPSFRRTGADWTAGTWVEDTLGVTLINGSNTIEFRYAGADGGFVDLDRIRITAVNPPAPPDPDPPPAVVVTVSGGSSAARVSAAAKALLEQVGLAGRVESVRFDLTDRDGNIIGVVHPPIGVTIINSTDGGLKRSASGFVLAPDEADDVDIANDRVAPKWVLAGVRDEFPLGVLMWASSSHQPWSYGTWMPGALLDQGLILGQGISRIVALAVGDSVQSAIVDVCARAGFMDIIIEPTNATVTAPVAWMPGPTSTYASVLTNLAATGGYSDWYFDNWGRLTFRRSVDPNTVLPFTRYGYGGRITDGTIQMDDDALSAANQYVVIDTASAGGSIVGVYNLPDDDPNSAKRRSRVIPKFINAPGIGSIAAAEARAKAAAHQDPAGYETGKFQALPDPRHDTFDVVEFEGDNYLELGWTLRCAPGGPMEHTLKRVFPMEA